MRSRLTLNLHLYRTMYLIRMAEEKIRKEYPSDGMKTPVHLCVGSEAIAAGVCGALDSDDRILGTYRNHGLYLAKTGDTDGFFAELYGKAVGTAKRKAGSMHLMAPHDGLMGTSAAVATTRLSGRKGVSTMVSDGSLDCPAEEVACCGGDDRCIRNG